MARLLFFTCIILFALSAFAVVTLDSHCMKECIAYGYTAQACELRCRVKEGS